MGPMIPQGNKPDQTPEQKYAWANSVSKIRRLKKTYPWANSKARAPRYLHPFAHLLDTDSKISSF